MRLSVLSIEATCLTRILCPKQKVPIHFFTLMDFFFFNKEKVVVSYKWIIVEDQCAICI
jgi:hypothetical protein